MVAERSLWAEAALAGRPRLPHPRRTPRLLLPAAAVEGDVHIETIRLSEKFAKRKRLRILEPFSLVGKSHNTEHLACPQEKSIPAYPTTVL